MLAWQKFGNGETPIGAKGDKLVGNYYVAFDKAYKVEIAQLIAKENRRRG
jgi:arginyl-tRNA synthetase